MPHLRFRALEQNQVAQLSQTLIPEISKVTGTPEDYFTMEWISSAYFAQGKEFNADPFCEVLWFDRGQETQDQVARLITEQLNKMMPGRDVVVVFTLLSKNQYYENGRHFG